MRKIKSLPVSQSVQSGEMSITGMGDMITGCRALYAKVTPSNSSYVNVRAKEGGKGDNRLRLVTSVVYHSPFFSGKSGWKVNGIRLFGSFYRKISGSNKTSEKVQ